MLTKTYLASVAGLALSVLCLSTTAFAAPAADRTPAKVADTDKAVRTVSVTESEDDAANCSRARRRLWVEGEGWVVRRITTCR